MSLPANPHPEPVLVGDQLAMDFLNSIEVLSNPDTECLRDGEGLIRWLMKAGVIESAHARVLQAMDAGDLDLGATEARRLREWFRGTLNRLIGRPDARPRLRDLAPLNELLARGNWQWQVVTGHSDERTRRDYLEVIHRVQWTNPDQLLQPLALAMAELLCNEDLSRIKHCGNHVCTLMFLDRTKANKRRWCSMAVCGNRAKNAAHRARVAAGED